MDKQKQKEVAIEMKNNGADYAAIAKHLEKNGVRTIRGVPSSGYVYYLINGTKKKSGGAKRSSRNVIVQPHGTDKWSVLKAIENCQDFTPRTRKALLGLIFQEISG